MDKMARLQRTPAVLIASPAEEDHICCGGLMVEAP